MNGDPKVVVAYYSSTGSVHRLAQAVVVGAEKAGADVRLRRVPEIAPAHVVAANSAWAEHAVATAHIDEVTHDDLVWADAVALGTPTRFGLPSAQIKQFIDTTSRLWAAGQLANKVYASFTSAGTNHGGVEATLLALNNTFYHWGGLLVPPGYTHEIQFQHGNPYGASHVAADARMPGDVQLRSAEHLGDRIAVVARATASLRTVA